MKPHEAADRLTREVIALLREERERRKRSHQWVAERAGLHRSTISLIESGKRVPSILVCAKLAQALEMELSGVVKRAERRAGD